MKWGWAIKWFAFPLALQAIIKFNDDIPDHSNWLLHKISISLDTFQSLTAHAPLNFNFILTRGYFVSLEKLFVNFFLALTLAQHFRNSYGRSNWKETDFILYSQHVLIFLLFSHTKPLNLLLSNLYPFLLCKQQIQKDLFWHKIENLSYFNSCFSS